MLWRINPSAKLLANLIGLVACMFVFDPITPTILFLAAIFVGIFGGALRWKHLKKFAPFLLFAVGMVWMNAAWAKIPDAKVIGRLGFFTFTDKGLMLGISLGMRILAIASFSLLVTLATDPTDLMLSLVQQCKLSPSIAYGILAALRFFPTIETELSTIKAAHRIRGKSQKGLRASTERWYRYAIPLLAGGIRKAERTAIAMEARGFSSGTKRTYYRTIKWHTRDTVFVAATLMVIISAIYISKTLGYKIAFSKWQGF